MPDVLLGQAYYLRFDPKLWKARQPYPPLGTLYAASYLRERGHAIALFDAMLADSPAGWRQALDREQPRIAVIYEDSFNYLSKMCLLRMRDAAFAMIDHARQSGRPVIVSGSDATDHPELYLARGAAAVILGEGEVTLAELVERLLAGQRVAGVPGAATLGPDGTVHRGPARPFLRSLDDLPLPAWDLVDIDRYRAIWRGRHGYHSMNVATTRGCPFHCNWCAKPIYGQRYAVRSAASVAAEFAWLKRTYAPDHLWVVDDVFGLKPGWVADFARELDARGAHIPFRCLMRADQVSRAVAASLAASGCRMVWMGAESGSQRILDAMEKGLRVDDIREACRHLRQSGIATGLFLQFGYPGETWDDVQATLELVRDLDPADIGVSVSYPLPGTRFHERVRDELGQKQNWVDSDDLAVMYHATYAPEFYRELHHAVHFEFRARRLVRQVAALARAPWRARPADLRPIASWGLNRWRLARSHRRLAKLAADPAHRASIATLPPQLSPAAAATPTRQDDWPLGGTAPPPAGSRP
ncbi:MAG: radical SAM protein [Acidobacteriota bacterium]